MDQIASNSADSQTKRVSPQKVFSRAMSSKTMSLKIMIPETEFSSTTSFELVLSDISSSDTTTTPAASSVVPIDVPSARGCILPQDRVEGERFAATLDFDWHIFLVLC